MSEMATLEGQNAGVEGITPTVTKLAPKKRSVRQFLSQYRSLGLPGAKQFRRRTRLEEAAYRHNIDVQMVKGLIRKLVVFGKVIEELKKESNWAMREHVEEGGLTDLVWIGESDPLEIIRLAEKEIG